MMLSYAFSSNVTVCTLSNTLKRCAWNEIKFRHQVILNEQHSYLICFIDGACWVFVELLNEVRELAIYLASSVSFPTFMWCRCFGFGSPVFVSPPDNPFFVKSCLMLSSALGFLSFSSPAHRLPSHFYPYILFLTVLYWIFLSLPFPL